MCDYSLHAVASRPAEVGETLISTTFRGTSTRGFASENDPAVAVCMLPGTELAFADDVKYDNRWIWTNTLGFRVGKFNQIEAGCSRSPPRCDRIPRRQPRAGDPALRRPACHRAAIAGTPVNHRARAGGERRCVGDSLLGDVDLDRLILRDEAPPARRRSEPGMGGAEPCGQQGHLAKGRPRHRARPLHVQVRLAHGERGRSCDLAAVSRCGVHAGQPASEPDAAEEFHLGAFELPVGPVLDEH